VTLDPTAELIGINVTFLDELRGDFEWYWPVFSGCCQLCEICTVECILCMNNYCEDLDLAILLC
jgi:predicted metal-binding protein